MSKKWFVAAAIGAMTLPRAAYALQADELLALVAMPLAVASVSEITGVPQEDLASVVQLLNASAVPPAQVIEVVRYVPVALVESTPDRNFVTYLNTQRDQGVSGVPLIDAIERELRTYGVPSGVELDVTAPRVAYEQATVIPEFVQTRVSERPQLGDRSREHPHGGPPGLLKKQVGVQTGAEIVHGAAFGDRDRRSKKPEHQTKAKHHEERSVSIAAPAPASRVLKEHGPKGGGGNPHGGGKGNGGGKEHGGGHGKGKGR